MDRVKRQMLVGDFELTSPWFSNQWELLQNGNQLAQIERLGRVYVSMVTLPDGSRWALAPHGQGVVRVVDANGDEFARVTRRSWIGRRWDLTSQIYSYELISNRRPRAWTIAIGGAPVAEFHGSLVSYNHVHGSSLVAVPMSAVLLAWHVIARPWEAAAEPRGLVPVPEPSTDRPSLGQDPFPEATP
jgi:hypothetical protein